MSWCDNTHNPARLFVKVIRWTYSTFNADAMKSVAENSEMGPTQCCFMNYVASGSVFGKRWEAKSHITAVVLCSVGVKVKLLWWALFIRLRRPRIRLLQSQIVVGFCCNWFHRVWLNGFFLVLKWAWLYSFNLTDSQDDVDVREPAERLILQHLFSIMLNFSLNWCFKRFIACFCPNEWLRNLSVGK